MLLHVCSVMKYVHFYINAGSSTTSWLIIHDIMYTSRYNTINAVGYAYIKYEKETGYHDSAYVPQCTNMCNAPASKRWLHEPPQVCSQMAFIFWLIPFACYKVMTYVNICRNTQNSPYLPLCATVWQCHLQTNWHHLSIFIIVLDWLAVY